MSVYDIACIFESCPLADEVRLPKCFVLLMTSVEIAALE